MNNQHARTAPKQEKEPSLFLSWRFEPILARVSQHKTTHRSVLLLLQAYYRLKMILSRTFLINAVSSNTLLPLVGREWYIARIITLLQHPLPKYFDISYYYQAQLSHIPSTASPLLLRNFRWLLIERVPPAFFNEPLLQTLFSLPSERRELLHLLKLPLSEPQLTKWFDISFSGRFQSLVWQQPTNDRLISLLRGQNALSHAHLFRLSLHLVTRFKPYTGHDRMIEFTFSHPHFLPSEDEYRHLLSQLVPLTSHSIRTLLLAQEARLHSYWLHQAFHPNSRVPRKRTL